MKVRIISAIVGIALMVGILACPWAEALVVACAVLAAVAVYELLHNTGLMKQKSLLGISMGFSAIEVMVCYYSECGWLRSLVTKENAFLYTVLNFLPVIVLGIFVLALLVHIAIPGIKVSFDEGQYAFLLTAYATAGFGCIALMRQIRNIGWWLVILVMLIAWMSDTGAYFVGTFLGKHKMAPKISPKKSWEGFFGGWVISVLCAVLLFMIRFWVENAYGDGLFYTLYLYLPVVIILAPLSVCGDLLASVIKRHTGIKDYGNIMPGHGGVMDRFDSVIFIAPMLYLIADNISAISRFMTGLFH